MKYNKREDGVSPVIAILIVVSIVVLAAVLYVTVMGRTDTNTEISTPLGLKQDTRIFNSSSVNIIISSAPNGATTDEVRISYTHDGTRPALTATLYDAAGNNVATYTSILGFDAFDATVILEEGMHLVVTPASESVSTGDVITISSSQNTFAISRLTITLPLGLSQESKTSNSVTMVISSDPNGPTTDGVSISYTHDGTPAGVTAKLYDAAGNNVATYDASGFSATVTLTRDMALIVSPASGSVSVGDLITISSSQNTFATSTLTVTTQQITTPLGLCQQSKTSSWVNILISSTPHGATTDGVSISYTHGGTPATVTATLYNSAGTDVATYSSGAFNDTTITLTSGMTLVITPTAGSVSAGDVITISSSQNTFGVSTVTLI